MHMFVEFSESWVRRDVEAIAGALKRIAAAQEAQASTASARLDADNVTNEVLKDIRDLLKLAVAPAMPAVILELTQTLEGKEIIGMVNLTDIQKYAIRIKDELDAKENPVPAAGPFTFLVSDTTLGSLADDADGLGTTFSAAGPLGSGSVTATDSSNSLQGVSQFTVGPSAAVTIELAEGTPVNQ